MVDDFDEAMRVRALARLGRIVDLEGEALLTHLKGVLTDEEGRAALHELTLSKAAYLREVELASLDGCPVRPPKFSASTAAMARLRARRLAREER